MKFNDLSPQYRRHIVLKGMRKCPVCGGEPSIRSPKGLYCEKHVEARAERERRRIGIKRRMHPPTTWIEVDWTLGVKVIATMLGVKVQAVRDNYQRLLARRLITAVEGILPVAKMGRGRKAKHG